MADRPEPVGNCRRCDTRNANIQGIPVCPECGGVTEPNDG